MQSKFVQQSRVKSTATVPLASAATVISTAPSKEDLKPKEFFYDSKEEADIGNLKQKDLLRLGRDYQENSYAKVVCNMAYMLAYNAKDAASFGQFQTKAKSETREFLSRLNSSLPAGHEEIVLLEKNGINKNWFSYEYFINIDSKVGLIANWVVLKYKQGLESVERQIKKEIEAAKPAGETTAEIKTKVEKQI